MSQRNTVGQPFVNHGARGVDQRTQPTLVGEMSYSMAKGTYFGFQSNVSRLEGKKLKRTFTQPVVHLATFNNVALIQTLDTLQFIPLNELLV